MVIVNRDNSFILKIKSTENDTWQGTIEWIEGRRSVPFRSGLELMMLIDSAIAEKSAGTPAVVKAGAADV